MQVRKNIYISLIILYRFINRHGVVFEIYETAFFFGCDVCMRYGRVINHCNDNNVDI